MGLLLEIGIFRKAVNRGATQGCDSAQTGQEVQKQKRDFIKLELHNINAQERYFKG